MIWKTLSTKLVYENKWMQVTEDRVETDTGRKLLFGVVHKNPCTHIIPWDGTHFTLVRQYRYPLQSFTWEFPAGHFDSSSMAAMAKAELEQETGLVAKKMRAIGQVTVAAGYSNQIAHVFLATELSEGKQDLEESEEGLTTKRVTPTQLRAMINKGLMKSSNSIAAFGILCTKGIIELPA